MPEKPTARTLTGSSLDRAEACPASAVLPQREDKPGAAAVYGSKVHKELEDRSPELAERLLEQGDSLEELWPEGGVHEALVWYDPISRQAGWEKRPEGSHRDYGKFPEHYLVGTIDYLNPDLGICDDLKTGIYPPPPTTLQLALPAMAMWKQDGAKSQMASITQLRPKRPAYRNTRNHSEETLLEEQRRLDRVYSAHLLNKARLDAGHEPETNPSRVACRWCKAVCDKRV